MFKHQIYILFGLLMFFMPLKCNCELQLWMNAYIRTGFDSEINNKQC